MSTFPSCFLYASHSMATLPKLRGRHILSPTEKGGELAGILKLKRISDLRNRKLRGGQQFLRTQQALLCLVLGRRRAGIFLEHTAKPGVTQPQTHRNVLRTQRILHMLLHQEPRLIDLLHHIGVGESVVLFLLINHT